MSQRHAAATTRDATLMVRRRSEMTSRRRQFLTDAQGKRTAVVLPIEEYERLLEDLHDLGAVAERRDEATISLDELKHRLAEGDAV